MHRLKSHPTGLQTASSDEDDDVASLDPCALLLAVGAKAKGEASPRESAPHVAPPKHGPSPRTARVGGGGNFRRKPSSVPSSSTPVPNTSNNAAPDTQGRAWEPEEDAALLAAIEQIGFHWKAVAKLLVSTGRTDAMCRNRYTRIRAPLKQGVECKNRCKRCGQMKRGHTCTMETQGADASGKDRKAVELAAANHRAVLKLSAAAAAARPAPPAAPMMMVEVPCTWVQCDACEKWRRLFDVNEAELPDNWTCSLVNISCDTPEEEMEEEEEMEQEAADDVARATREAESSATLKRAQEEAAEAMHHASAGRSTMPRQKAKAHAPKATAEYAASAASSMSHARAEEDEEVRDGPGMPLERSFSRDQVKAGTLRRRENEEARFVRLGWTRIPRPDGKVVNGNPYAYMHEVHGVQYDKKKIFRMHAGEDQAKPDKEAVKRKLAAIKVADEEGAALLTILAGAAEAAPSREVSAYGHAAYEHAAYEHAAYEHAAYEHEAPSPVSDEERARRDALRAANLSRWQREDEEEAAELDNAASDLSMRDGVDSPDATEVAESVRSSSASSHSEDEADVASALAASALTRTLSEDLGSTAPSHATTSVNEEHAPAPSSAPSSSPPSGWTVAQDAELVAYVGRLLRAPKPLDSALLEIAGAIPSKTVRMIGDRWMLLSKTKALQCPETAQLEASVASATALGSA